MARADDALDLSKSSQVRVEHAVPVEEGTALQNASQLYCWQMTLRKQLVLDLSKSAKKDSLCDSSSCSSTTSFHELALESTRVMRKSMPLRHSRDASYYERRRKNNLAAKKSRDAKRKREAEIQARVIILEEENRKLREYLSLCCCHLRSVNAKYDLHI